MTTALDNVFTQMQVIEAAIAGVVVAYNKTPEALSVFPCFINYPRTGRTIGEAKNQMQSLYTIVAALHVARGILPEAESIARPFINLFEDAIFTDPTLAGTVMTVNEVRHTYGEVMFGSERHLACMFELDIKMRRAVGGTSP